MNFRVPFGRLTALCVALATVLVCAPGTASAEPALWKVQGPHATVYLFGTVHLLKSTTQWHSPKIDAAFASSGTLWEELQNADDPTVAAPLIAQLGLDFAHPLSSQLDDAGKIKVAAFANTYGLPPERVDVMRPWLAAMMFSVLPMVKAGYDPKSGVDGALKQLAAAQKKPLLAFETVEQQIHYFADLPQPVQLDYLLFTVSQGDRAASGLGSLVDAWASGDTTSLERLLNADLFIRYPSLYRILLVQRNRAFADKIETLLKGDGVTFVAVGAGHLVGPDSVQAALEKDGFHSVRQ